MVVGIKDKVLAALFISFAGSENQSQDFCLICCKLATNLYSPVLSIAGLLAVVFFISLLISIFRRKYQGYPYSLLLP